MPSKVIWCLPLCDDCIGQSICFECLSFEKDLIAIQIKISVKCLDDSLIDLPIDFIYDWINFIIMVASLAFYKMEKRSK